MEAGCRCVTKLLNGIINNRFFNERVISTLQAKVNKPYSNKHAHTLSYTTYPSNPAAEDNCVEATVWVSRLYERFSLSEFNCLLGDAAC